MSYGWFLGLGSASLIFFVAYIVLSSRNYKRRFNENYDFRNHFPYEFNYEAPFSENILGNVALILSLALSISLFSLMAAYKNNNGVLLFVLVSGIIFSIATGAIHFIPLKYLKSHMLVSVVLFAASFATPAAVALTAMKEYQLQNETICLVFTIISFIFAGFAFLLVMNPKLSLNIKMEVATDDKGEEIYLRPKYIVYALTEWILIFLLAISEILTVILLKIL